MDLGKEVKRFKSKKGNDVVIRYLKKEDLDDLLKFANDLSKEDTFVMLAGEEITREEEEKYLNEAIEKIREGNKVQLVVIVNGMFAGNAEIRRNDKRKKHVGTIAISIAKEFREEGIGTELLKTLIGEGRNLGLKLLILSCFAINGRALAVYNKLGFRPVGTIPGIYSYRGKYVDEVLLYLPLV